MLTEDGLQNVKKVVALIFEYLRKLQEEWLAEGEILNVWQEQKTVSNLQYDVYPVRPAEEHVPEISVAMMFCNDITQVIKRTQESIVID